MAANFKLIDASFGSLNGGCDLCAANLKSKGMGACFKGIRIILVLEYICKYNIIFQYIFQKIPGYLYNFLIIS
jgi:hypothetical protein